MNSSGKIVIRMKIIKIIIMVSCIFAIAIAFNVLQLNREYRPLFASSPNVSNSVGVNAHLSFSNSVNYTSELCKSLWNNGVKFIRLDVYWWYGNYKMQQTEIDKAVYMADKNNLSILLNFPIVPTRTDEKTMKYWTEMLAFYASRYDGTHEIRPNGEKKGRKIKIDYFEIMNEPDIACPRNGISVGDLFKMTKLSSEAIRNIRSDALMVLPGLCYSNDFSKKYLSYKDAEGHTLKDYVDILNVHTYFDNQKAYIKQLEEWASLFRSSGLIDRPLWITEYGHSSWEYTEEERANMYIQQTLIGLSLGVEKMFYYQFHSFGGNYFSSHPQREEYFGMISPSISNSYASFLENDGTWKNALSKGDGLQRVYIREMNKDSLSIYTLNKTICDKLKTNGLAVSGNGFTLNSISIVHNDSRKIRIWNGSVAIRAEKSQTGVVIHKQAFQNVEETDKIVFRISDVKDMRERWIGAQSYPVYESLSTLTSLLQNIAERPKMKDENGYTKITWNNNNVIVLWSTDGKPHKVNCEESFIVVNRKGEKNNQCELSFVEPTFIIGNEKLTIK